MKLILLGAPGAGKGTQAKMIAEKCGIPHISTGDIFRANIKNGTELGAKAKEYMDKGLLVPDELVCDLVVDRIQQADCEKGYILDGFPRTIAQAEALKVLTKDIAREVNVVINLACDPSVLIGRISGRRVCKKCGNSYHIETKKPLVEGVCDACGEPLIQRPDDTEEALKVRLDAYENQTKPLIEFYKNEGLLKEVDGLQGINDVFGDIKNILEGK